MTSQPHALGPPTRGAPPANRRLVSCCAGRRTDSFLWPPVQDPVGPAVFQRTRSCCLRFSSVFFYIPSAGCLERREVPFMALPRPGLPHCHWVLPFSVPVSHGDWEQHPVRVAFCFCHGLSRRPCPASRFQEFISVHSSHAFVVSIGTTLAHEAITSTHKPRATGDDSSRPDDHTRPIYTHQRQKNLPDGLHFRRVGYRSSVCLPHFVLCFSVAVGKTTNPPFPLFPSKARVGAVPNDQWGHPEPEAQSIPRVRLSV